MTYDASKFPDVRGQGWSRYKVHRTLRSGTDTAGDQVAVLHGTNILWGYMLGWRTLTATDLAAIRAAATFMAGTHAQDFLEWRTGAEANLAIGTGTGAGALVLDLHAHVPDANAPGAGLVIRRNGVALAEGADWSISERTSGANFVDHQVTIVLAANVSGAAYTASWTAARRRRTVRPGPGGFKWGRRPRTDLWIASIDLVETESGT